ncbi:hypothetical protein PR048_009735 [Dryococelus australis]|uniref:Uncharacterized protein n=1 Tax=Dryococelus australis TaxID=614101 RepID=A0ABQ9I150_9NEOP|nr:hypothetical protein PR048_009735 [Dryococelus australis]
MGGRGEMRLGYTTPRSRVPGGTRNLQCRARADGNERATPVGSPLSFSLSLSFLVPQASDTELAGWGKIYLRRHLRPTGRNMGYSSCTPRPPPNPTRRSTTPPFLRTQLCLSFLATGRTWGGARSVKGAMEPAKGAAGDRTPKQPAEVPTRRSGRRVPGEAMVDATTSATVWRYSRAFGASSSSCRRPASNLHGRRWQFALQRTSRIILLSDIRVCARVGARVCVCACVGSRRWRKDARLSAPVTRTAPPGMLRVLCTETFSVKSLFAPKRVPRGDVWAALNIEVLRAQEGGKRCCKGGGNGRSATSSGTIPSRDNPGATQQGIEPGSPGWEANSLTPTPPRQMCHCCSSYNFKFPKRIRTRYDLRAVTPINYRTLQYTIEMEETVEIRQEMSLTSKVDNTASASDTSVNTEPLTPAGAAACVACPTDTTQQFAMLMQMMQAQAIQMQNVQTQLQEQSVKKQTQLQEVKCNANCTAQACEIERLLNEIEQRPVHPSDCAVIEEPVTGTFESVNSYVEIRLTEVEGAFEHRFSNVEDKVDELTQAIAGVQNLQLFANEISREEIQLRNSSTTQPEVANTMPSTPAAATTSNAQALATPLSTILHHLSTSWAEQQPKFEGRLGENHINFLIKLEATKVQGNLRAKLHTEKFFPGKDRGLETHLSDLYERSKHLTPPLSNEEFIAMAHWTGRTDNDLVAFREDLLAFDQIDSFQRTHGGREGEKAAHVERAPTLYQGHPHQQFRGNGGHGQHPRVQSYQVGASEPPQSARGRQTPPRDTAKSTETGTSQQCKQRSATQRRDVNTLQLVCSPPKTQSVYNSTQAGYREQPRLGNFDRGQSTRAYTPSTGKECHAYGLLLSEGAYVIKHSQEVVTAYRRRCGSVKPLPCCTYAASLNCRRTRDTWCVNCPLSSYCRASRWCGVLHLTRYELVRSLDTNIAEPGAAGLNCVVGELRDIWLVGAFLGDNSISSHLNSAFLPSGFQSTAPILLVARNDVALEQPGPISTNLRKPPFWRTQSQPHRAHSPAFMSLKQTNSNSLRDRLQPDKRLVYRGNPEKAKKDDA